MLVAMSLEILPIFYHINLSVVAGILLGPALGFLAAFIANLILAFMGHGGITVIGLNTLLLGSEAVLGHTLFYLLSGSRVLALSDRDGPYPLHDDNGSDRHRSRFPYRSGAPQPWS